MAINRCPHQCHTPAALSRAYLEKPGYMHFLVEQSMQRHLPGFLKDLPQGKNLIFGAATWMKTILAIFRL